MADHKRKRLRDAAVTALTGLTTTASRVFVGRTRPLAAKHAPTLLIYTSSETATRDRNGNPPELERTVTLHIEGRVSLPSAQVPDDLLDTIAAEVEAAMWANMKFGGLAFDSHLVTTEVQTESDGQSQIGGIRIEYSVRYASDEGSPTL